MATPAISLRLPPELVQELDAEAGRRGVNRTELVTDAIRRFLGHESRVPTQPGLLEPTAPVEVALPNAIQLSVRTGLPKATCQGMLDRGEVRWRSRPESSDVVLEVRGATKWRILE